jgi:hypothetical protein
MQGNSHGALSVNFSCTGTFFLPPYATTDTRALFHLEDGKANRPKAIKLQLKARCARKEGRLTVGGLNQKYFVLSTEFGYVVSTELSFSRARARPRR